MQENSNESRGDDRDTLFMLSGMALTVFGAGLVLSNPNRQTISPTVRDRKSGPVRVAGSGSRIHTAVEGPHGRS